MENNNKEQHKIIRRLDMIISLLFENQSESKTTVDKATAMREKGFENGEIASILGTTPGTIAVLLSRKKGGKSTENGSI